MLNLTFDQESKKLLFGLKKQKLSVLSMQINRKQIEKGIFACLTREKRRAFISLTNTKIIRPFLRNRIIIVLVPPSGLVEKARCLQVVFHLSMVRLDK